MNEIRRIESEDVNEHTERRRAGRNLSVVRFILMVACLVASIICFVNADGAFNYNISLNAPDKTIGIGETLVIDAYVSFNGNPVREYPCILTFYDYLDNRSLISKREYTDELGQFHHVMTVDDTFRYETNYTYDLKCSNVTEAGSIYTRTSNSQNWFYNYLTYTNTEASLIVIIGTVLLTVLVIAWMWAKAIWRA